MGAKQCQGVAKRASDYPTEEVTETRAAGFNALQLRGGLAEEDLTGLYNDERLRVNYFWLVGKKELEDKQAELRNKNREYQDLEEKNSITIKIWRQRLKHLMFQNVDQQTQLKKDAQIKLKNSEDEHRINERELK